MRYERYNNERALAYAAFLREFEWDYYYTVTFRHYRKDHLAAIRDVAALLLPDPDIDRCFIVAEGNKGVGCHLHGLVYYGFLELMPSPCILWRHLFHKFGRAQVQRITSARDVTNYCSKYVVKDLNQCYYDFLGDSWG